MSLFFRSLQARKPSKTYIDDNGYYRFSNSHEYIHHWWAEEKECRKLLREEVVHHINHNKQDNSDENLYVCRNQFEHYRIHALDRKYGISKGIGHLKKQSPITTALAVKFGLAIATILISAIIAMHNLSIQISQIIAG